MHCIRFTNILRILPNYYQKYSSALQVKVLFPVVFLKKPQIYVTEFKTCFVYVFGQRERTCLTQAQVLFLVAFL